MMLGLLPWIALCNAKPSESDLPVIKIASLDWPPYTAEYLPEQGFTTALVKRVFLNMGYQLEVVFLPWSRAIYESKHRQSEYIGYFPEYPLDDNDVQLSASLGKSEINLIQHIDSNIIIGRTLDLKRYSFFVVKDYVNTPELDDYIARNVVQPLISLSDKNSILKIAYKRADLAVIDGKVFDYLITHDEELQAKAKGKVKLHPFALGAQTLHIAFNKHNPKYPELVNQFNAELLRLLNESQIDATAN